MEVVLTTPKDRINDSRHDIPHFHDCLGNNARMVEITTRNAVDGATRQFLSPGSVADAASAIASGENSMALLGPPGNHQSVHIPEIIGIVQFEDRRTTREYVLCLEADRWLKERAQRREDS